MCAFLCVKIKIKLNICIQIVRHIANIKYILFLLRYLYGAINMYLCMTYSFAKSVLYLLFLCALCEQLLWLFSLFLCFNLIFFWCFTKKKICWLWWKLYDVCRAL
jgi:hypothetical protein